MIVRNKWIKWFALSSFILVLIMLSLDKMQFQLPAKQQKYQTPASMVLIAKLKERIEREVPALNGRIGDFEKVNLLREWAYTNIDFSSKKALIEQDEGSQFFKQNIYLLFSAFSEDRGGVWCHGAAHVLMKLYFAYGFKASTLDSGKPGVMTHVVTLVQINHDGRQRTVIQDPTFNLTYVDSDGAPYDYNEFLGVLMKRRHTKIKVLQGHSQSHDFLLHPDDLKREYSQFISKDSKPSLIMENGIQKYKSELTLLRFKQTLGSRINTFLVKMGYPSDPIYLFLFPVAYDTKSHGGSGS